jgi:hypothetical protein
MCDSHLKSLKETPSNSLHENPPKKPPKITEKEKHREQRIWKEIVMEDVTMNIVGKSSDKSLARNTNL